jgi:dihydropyrimidinase
VSARPDGWRDFTEIPGGLPGVETRLALAYQGVVEGRFDAARWVALVATAPARRFGLERKGSLAAGMDADLVVFDPAATRRLDAEALHMRTDHSPYEGTTISGWPALTISRGRIVARDGEPVDHDPTWGRFVRRSPLR